MSGKAVFFNRETAVIRRYAIGICFGAVPFIRVTIKSGIWSGSLDAWNFTLSTPDLSHSQIIDPVGLRGSVAQKAEDTEKRTDIQFFERVVDILVFGRLDPSGTKAFMWYVWRDLGVIAAMSEANHQKGWDGG